MDRGAKFVMEKLKEKRKKKRLHCLRVHLKESHPLGSFTDLSGDFTLGGYSFVLFYPKVLIQSAFCVLQCGVKEFISHGCIHERTFKGQGGSRGCC